MIANRPDWCISRQRSWGVPIPALYCTACRHAVLTPELIDRAAQVFEQDGADAWYEREVSAFVPPGFRCPSCGGTEFERERDILDVWFDSGSSHEGALAQRPDLSWPADVYLEGTDQYRGWFQSSLLVALGTRDAPPYRQVLTHGFVVDEAGRKMSKSLGNVVAPQDVIATSGAEILRLWVAMVDYREEVRIGPEILARVVEAYRKIRNTLRILLANLYDFEPARDSLPLGQLQEIDRYALARYADAGLRIRRAYERYEFQTVFHTVNSLLTVDVSAFYVDVSKDRLYTLAPRAPARRSAQTAMYRMADGLARLLAPILPVTADEVWRLLPGPRDESVHLAEFPDDLDTLADPALVERWQRLLKLRDVVNDEIERLRQQKQVGTSLEAKVRLRAAGSAASLLQQYHADLPMLFITSQVELETADAAALRAASSGRVYSEPGGAVLIEVDRAEGVKCQRCWRYVPTVATSPAQEGLCERCVETLAAPVEDD